MPTSDLEKSGHEGDSEGANGATACIDLGLGFQTPAVLTRKREELAHVRSLLTNPLYAEEARLGEIRLVREIELLESRIPTLPGTYGGLAALTPAEVLDPLTDPRVATGTLVPERPLLARRPPIETVRALLRDLNEQLKLYTIDGELPVQPNTPHVKLMLGIGTRILQQRNEVAAMLARMERGHTLKLFEGVLWEVDAQKQIIRRVPVEPSRDGLKVPEGLSDSNLGSIRANYLLMLETSSKPGLRTAALQHLAAIGQEQVKRGLNGAIEPDDESPTAVTVIGPAQPRPAVPKQTDSPPKPASAEVVRGWTRGRIAAWAAAAGLLLTATGAGIYAYLVGTKDEAGSATQVTILASDGVPADASQVVKSGEPLPPVLAIDPDGTTGPLPNDAVRVALVHRDGTPFTFSPSAEGTAYGAALRLVVDGEIPQGMDPDLFVAAVPRMAAKELAPVNKDSLLGKIQDTEASYKTIRRETLEWGDGRGGWETVWESVDTENLHRTDRGEPPITIPSELIGYLKSDACDLPNGHAIAHDLLVEASLMREPSVAVNMQDATARLAAVKAKVPELAKTLKAGDIKEPAFFKYEPTDPTRTKFGSLDEALDTSVAESTDFARGAEMPLDVYEAPDPQHVKALSPEAQAEVNMNLDWKAGLMRLKAHIEAKKTRLSDTARGRNKDLVPAFCDAITQQLEDLCASPIQSAEALRVATMDFKTDFFDKMDLLANGDGGFKSEYLRVFAADTMQRVATVFNALPKKPGVEGVQEDTQAQVFAVRKGMFRKEA